MTTELAIPELDLNKATLDELAHAAGNEYQQTAAHLAGALGHFIRLGDILLAARQRVPDGEWIRWLDDVGIHHYATAARAMRIAYYKDHLPPEAFQVRRDLAGRVLSPSWNHALEYLRGLPDIRSKGNRLYPPETRQEANRLRQTGLSFREVGRMLNVSENAVREWCDPDYYKRQRESRRRTKQKRKAAVNALKERQRREEAEALARLTGGELTEAYSLIRRALATIDRSRRAPDAIRHLHRAEESIVAAMRAESAEP